MLILGGGIAGIEALLALRDLAGDRAEATLVAADPDFVYKLLIVEERSTTRPRSTATSSPRSRSWARVSSAGSLARCARIRIRSWLRRARAMTSATPAKRGYDLLVAHRRSLAGSVHAVTFRFRSVGDPLEVEDLIARAEAHESKTPRSSSRPV